jgi:alcohol oxidase
MLASWTSELFNHPPNLAKLTIDIDSDADLVILRWGYKKTRELARRLKYYAGDVVVGHPNFKPGSKAATSQSDSPTALTASEIVYSKEDDDVIDEFHRRTSWFLPLVYFPRAKLTLT